MVGIWSDLCSYAQCHSRIGLGLADKGKVVQNEITACGTKFSMTRKPAEVGCKEQVFLVLIHERPRHCGNVQCW